MTDLEKFSPWNYTYNVKDQLKEFIYKRSNEAFAEGDVLRDSIRSIEELEKRKVYIREKFIEALGGLPSSDAPLNPVITGIIHCRGFRIEKVIFESRPKVFVTANLYIPGEIAQRRGAVLFLCGHHEQAKHQDEYQIVCQYLVRAGLVVLAQDPVGQGERFSYYEKSLGKVTIRWGTEEHDYAGSQCYPLGDSLARYFVHDAMRGIDYLCTRPEVDPQKIGVTGNSGGGTQTSLLMICDPRVAAAAPATFIMNRQSYMYAGGAQDAEQVWSGMTAFGFDHEDILLMMAPKPVLVLAAKYDFFPIEGTRRTFERSRRFWSLFRKEENIRIFEDNSEHKYTRAMAKKAAEFFSAHLLGWKAVPEDKEIEALTPSKLWCTKSGQVRGEIEDARFVFDENLQRLEEIEKTRDALQEQERKEMAIAWLGEKVFAYRVPCDLNVRHILCEQELDLTVQSSMWWTQEGILNSSLTFRNYRFLGKKLPVSIAVWDGGTTQLQPHAGWIRETCSKGRAVMVLDVSGAGNLMPNSLNCYPPLQFYGVIHKLANDLMWINDSLAAMRVFDVMRALDALDYFDYIDKEDIRIYAYGRQGVYGQLAAVLDKRIKRVEVVEGIGSYKSWVASRYYDPYDVMSIVIPGMLKYFDLPDLEKWGFLNRADFMKG